MCQDATKDARRALHIIEPVSAHTHTAIILHGRGSNGPEFEEELSDTRLSDGSSLLSNFPGWRWVFPSSNEFWNETFQEHMPEWFEAPSLADPTIKKEAQIPGIVESYNYIEALIADEIKLLGGKSENLLFGGISQGGAVALWMLLCRHATSQIGAFFAASTWLPFSDNIEKILLASNNGTTDSAGQDLASIDADGFIRQHMQCVPGEQRTASEIKVFLGHGLDDAYVDASLGRQARHVLTVAGFDVEWKEYSGADQEGHWLQEPTEMDDICQFIIKSIK